MTTKTNKQCNISRAGFTLIETLVALSVLMIGVIGPIQIISTYLIDAQYSKNKVAAAYLGQEGVELAANLIKNDSQRFKGATVNGSTNWPDYVTNIALCNPSASLCNITVNADKSRAETACDSLANALNLSSTANCQIPIDNVVFTRKLSIEPVNWSIGNDSYPAKEYKISVWVNWSQRGVIKHYTAQSFITISYDQPVS